MSANVSDPRSEREKRQTLPSVSGCFPDGSIVELVYRPEQPATTFAVWRDSRWTIEQEYRLPSGECLVPFSPNNNVIKNDVVVLPSGPEEYGTKGDLIDDLQQFLHRYLDVSLEFEMIAAHYVLFTWIYDAFNEVPYIRFQGDFGTGKTRALLVVGSVCYKGFFASGASTVSPLFHILNAFRGTLILDEADFRFSDEKAEIVKILNNGNVRGVPVLRTLINRHREFDPQAFQVFGPKLVAMRGSYDDRALESRFLTEVMGQASLRSDIPINLPAAMRVEAQTLRNKLLLFRFQNRHTVTTENMPALTGVAPRVSQILSPLLRVVDDPTAREIVMSAACAADEKLIADRGLSSESQLLEIIQELSGEAHRSLLPIKDIADRFGTRFGHEYERPISPRWVGTILRRRLLLTPFKSHGRFVLSVASERLSALYERFGIATQAEDVHELRANDSGDGEKGTALPS